MGKEHGKLVDNLTAEEESHKGEIPKVLQELRDSQLAAVRKLAEINGVDLTGLSPYKMETLVLDVIASLNTKRRWQLQAARCSEGITTNAQTIEIDPGLIEVILNISPENQPRINLAPDRKVMLGYFALLTQQKVARYLDPVITREELASYARPFTREQLTDHLFDPFAKAGLLAVGAQGYRLNCCPEDVIEIILQDRPTHQLSVPGFSTWISQVEIPVLLTKQFLPFLSAIAEMSEGAGTDEILDVEKLAESAEFSKDWAYNVLRELESLHLAYRQEAGARYTYNDFNLILIKTILEAQKKPISILVKKRETDTAVYPPPVPGESRWTKALRIKDIEEPEFPRVSFKESGVVSANIEELIADRPALLDMIETLLTASLEGQTVSHRDGRTIFYGRLPEINFGRNNLIAILDFIGLGPKELEENKMDLASSPTLAALINRLEKSQRLDIQILAGEIKARLAGLFIGDIVTQDEGRKLKFSAVMGLLDDAKTKPIVEPTVTATPVPGTMDTPPQPPGPLMGERKLTPAEKLAQTIDAALKRELLSALSQPSVFVTPQPPTAAFNYHRILSDRADLIPWRSLQEIGLAVSDLEGNYHPHITPAGALVISLYFRHSVHERVIAIDRNEKERLKAIGRGIATFLSGYLEESKLGERERQYFTACLDNFRVAGIVV